MYGMRSESPQQQNEEKPNQPKPKKNR
jgi:hypothetical protein